ncbi:MAG: TadE/TadG family type IV pilus assembly protein [Solirubrobacteraceae bacterium]
MRLRNLHRQDGQALVELAFVIPLLLLFLFGIIDFGLALNTANTDTNIANYAVREAAVIGTSTSATCASGGTVSTENNLQSWAQCEDGASGTSAPSVCVADVAGPSPSATYTIGDPVKVEVTSTFHWLSLLVGAGGYFGGIVQSAASQISSSATMRLEASVSAASTSGTNPFLSPTCTS